MVKLWHMGKGVLRAGREAFGGSSSCLGSPIDSGVVHISVTDLLPLSSSSLLFFKKKLLFKIELKKNNLYK